MVFCLSRDQLDDLNIEIVSGRHLDEEMKTTLKQMTGALISDTIFM